MADAQRHQQLNASSLAKRPASDKWNILECYEHMNLYGTEYLGFFEEALNKGKKAVGTEQHKSGMLGAYAIKSMAPVDDLIPKPMKTLKSTNPINQDIDAEAITLYLSA